MLFKIDENLPVEVAETVHSERVTGVSDQQLSEICQQENRILMTLDIGFANIRTYPPQDFPGLVVIRSKRQDKPSILNKVMVAFEQEELVGKLWIVEENRIRIRS